MLLCEQQTLVYLSPLGYFTVFYTLSKGGLNALCFFMSIHACSPFQLRVEDYWDIHKTCMYCIVRSQGFYRYLRYLEVMYNMSDVNILEVVVCTPAVKEYPQKSENRSISVMYAVCTVFGSRQINYWILIF